jgi:signal peptidase II
LVGPVYFWLTYNRGAAFSLGSGISPVIVAVAVALVVVVIVLSGRVARGGGSWASVVALGLLSGGALSNLADRFFRHHHGGVVDFIQLVSWWPIFNVADASITIGALTIAVSLALSPPSRRPLGKPAAVAPGDPPDRP